MIQVTRKRLIVTAAVLLLLAGILVVTWRVCDWPPPRLILKYGFPPVGLATGRSKVIHGNTFVELSPGYRHVDRPALVSRGSWIGDICKSLGLSVGAASIRSAEYEDRWVEVDHYYWISTEPLTGVAYRRVGGVIRTLRPFPGGLRPPTSSELWSAALAGALALGDDTVAVDFDGSATLNGRPDDAFLLGWSWEHPTTQWESKQLRSTPWRSCPVIWVPPQSEE